MRRLQLQFDNAVRKEREKNKKLRAKLSNANRMLKKRDLDEESQDPDDREDPSDPNSGWLKPWELAIILDHMENNLQKLVGNGKSAQYKKDREKAWQRLLDEINAWNDSEGTGKVQTYQKVKKKIDNLKKNGKNFLYK